MATINSFAANATDASGNLGSTIGHFYLGSTQPETLTGTAGTTDVFAIMSFSGADVISGFESATAVGAAHDILDLSGRGISSYSQLQPMISGNSSTIINIGSGKTITLTDVSSNLLTSGDFRFS